MKLDDAATWYWDKTTKESKIEGRKAEKKELEKVTKSCKINNIFPSQKQSKTFEKKDFLKQHVDSGCIAFIFRDFILASLSETTFFPSVKH